MSDLIKTGGEISIDCSPWLRLSEEEHLCKEVAVSKQWVSLDLLVVEIRKMVVRNQFSLGDAPDLYSDDVFSLLGVVKGP